MVEGWQSGISDPRTLITDQDRIQPSLFSILLRPFVIDLLQAAILRLRIPLMAQYRTAMPIRRR